MKAPKGIFIIAFTFLSWTNFLISYSQEKAKIDIEWMYDMEAYTIQSLPELYWTSSGNLILFGTNEDGMNTIPAWYNLSNGREKALFKPEIALKSLSEFSDLSPFYEFPEQILVSPNGGSILYDIQDDLFVLNSQTGKFTRITETAMPEKSPVYSEDGSQLSFSSNNNLYHYDIEEKKLTQLTNDGSFEILNGTLSWVYWEEIFGRVEDAIWWSPDNQKIAFLKTDERSVEDFYFQDFEPANPNIYSQKYPKTGSKNPSVRIGIVDLKNENEISYVDFKDFEYEYFIRLKWLPGSNSLAIETLNRDQTELDLFFYNINERSIKRILKEENPGWVNIHEDLNFLISSDQFLWQSEKSGYAHLYLYDMNGKLINQITSGDWTLGNNSSLVSWVKKSIAFVDEKNQWVYFLAKKKSSIENHLYRIDFNGKNLMPLTENEPGMHEITFSPDGQYYLDNYSSITRPNELRLFKTANNTMRVISASREGLVKSLGIQSPHFFEIPASDGFLMPAAIMKPIDFDEGKKYPVIFHVYGGPSSPIVENKWDDEIYWQNILANNGYIVISVDNRSATGISKIMENSILLNTPNAELPDLIDAVTWIQQLPYINAERVGIWGWSGGGSFTLAAMTQSALFKAGIAIAPVSDWRYYDSKFGEMMMRTPATNEKGYETTSHVKQAMNLKGRLLLVHGTMDDNVHIQNSYAFANGLINAGITFDMMIYPNRDHSINDYEARIHLYRSMLEFWKKNL